MTFERLMRQVRNEQDALLARSDAQDRVRLRLAAADAESAFRAPRRDRSRLAFAAFAAAFAVAASVALVRRMGDDVPLRASLGEPAREVRAGEWLHASGGNPLPLRFSDGTRFELGPDSKARVVELHPSGAHLALESGRAHVVVVPHPDARWSVSTGPFTVHVKGTRFDVRWNPQQDDFALELHEGEVELVGCVFGSGRRIRTGESVRASCETPSLRVTKQGSERALETADITKAAPREPVASVVPDSGPSGSAAPVATPDSPVAARMARPEPSAAPLRAHGPRTQGPVGASSAHRVDRRAQPVWLRLARTGAYREAFAAAEAEGFEAQADAASADELLMLADCARHSSNFARAGQALKAVRRRFAGSSAAAIAAFSLGRLEFDGYGAHDRAAIWFERYLREQPGGDLTREARGRLLEALYRGGDVGRARVIAGTYLRESPKGPHAELARRVLGER